ncbi:MAG: response regulator transcription factor [Bacteroidota bacterium]
MKDISKIIIVDDHELFREGIKLLIEAEGLGTVIGEAKNGEEFLVLLKYLNPDLVLMDIEMPVMGGVEATRKAIEMKPDLRVLVLTMLNDNATYDDMFDAGALGFVLKTAGKQELERAIRTMNEGESFFSKELKEQIVLQGKRKKIDLHEVVKQIKLSPRDREVLQLFCQGLTNDEISSALFISNKTVEYYRKRLQEKTNTKNAIHLLLFAIRHGLVRID